MKILIDGDIELYKSCTSSENIYTWEEDLHTLVSDSREARQKMESAIAIHKNKIEEWLGDPCTVEICFSAGTDSNWRKHVYPPYKAFRIGGRRPIAFKFVKDWFLKNYKCHKEEGLEADDLLGILSTSDRDDCIIVSIDKDLLSVPGFLYNPEKYSVPKLISLEEADWFHVYQTLMGDRTDGYPGCYMQGKKTARRALGDPGKRTLEDLWKITWAAYKASGASWEAMVEQAKVARILRSGEWDQKNQKCLWNVPLVNET